MEREAEKIREEMCTVREVKCTCVCVRVCMWEIAWRERKSERGGVKRVEVENGESNQSISATRKCAKCKNERIALLIYVRRTLCSNRIFSTVRPRRAIDQSRRGDLERTCEMDRTFVASGYMLRRSRNTSKLRCILTLKNLSVRAIRLGFIKKRDEKSSHCLVLYRFITLPAFGSTAVFFVKKLRETKRARWSCRRERKR